MPWFLGVKSPGVYDHWCVGNSYYESWLGLYNQNQREIVGQQLDLMKSSGIDGLWIDYQLTSWDSVVDMIIDELEAGRGMGPLYCSLLSSARVVPCLMLFLVG